MANTSYLGSNVVTTDSFAGWIEKTNRIIYAMGTEVITVAGNNTGNVAITGAITANTVAVGQYLRGGNNTSNTALTVTSNTTFSGDLINITAANTTVGSSGANVLNINSIVAAVSNVTISGDLTNITSTNTSIGSSGFDTLNVNSKSNFNSNVNISSVLTVTANAIFSGANVAINGNTNIGDLASDRLVINAVLSSDLIPLDNTIDLGSTSNTYGNLHVTTSYTKDSFVSNTITISNTIIANTANITGSLSVSGNITLSSNLDLSDNKQIRLGDSQDLTIYHDSLNSYIKDLGTGNLKLLSSQIDLTNTAGSGTMATFADGGAVTLYHNNAKKFETVANGIYITGDLTASGVINLTSNVNLSVNTSTSNNSTIQNVLTVNGNTILGDASTDVIKFVATANSNLIPTSNVTYTLGNTTNQWASVFANNIIANNIAYSIHNQSSSSITLTTIVQTALATFSATTYGSAEVTITAKQGTSRHITKLLIVHDGTTAYATEYGSILTGPSLATYDVDISAGNVRILVTSASTSSTVYNVVLTLTH